MRNLDIAAVAESSGLPPSALRYYEEKGLIKSIGRRGLRRVYAVQVLERLALIALGRSAGFSLDEIARMFAPDGRVRIDRTKLAAKADELDRTIRELTAMRDGLRHAVKCSAPSHAECPKFQRIVRAAAAGALGKRPQRGALRGAARGSERGAALSAGRGVERRAARVEERGNARVAGRAGMRGVSGPAVTTRLAK